MSGCWVLRRAFVSLIFAVCVIVASAMMLGTGSAAEGTATKIESLIPPYSPPSSQVDKVPELDLQYHEWRMAQERTRQVAVGLLILTALVAHYLVLRSLGQAKACPPSQIVGATGLVYIILGTVILVLLVDNKDQLAASTGILGAVAGYLFGSLRDSKEKTSEQGTG